MRQSEETSDCLTISDSQYSLHIKSGYSRVLEWLNLCKIVCGDRQDEKLNMQMSLKKVFVKF